MAVWAEHYFRDEDLVDEVLIKENIGEQDTDFILLMEKLRK